MPTPDQDAHPVPDPAELIYRDAFMSVQQGFSLLEVLFDPQGQARDIIIRDANPAQQRIDGLQALIGKRVREILPDIEPKWIERYAQVVRSQEPAHFEDWSQANQRWYEVDAAPVGGVGSPLVTLIYNDITERKRIDRQQTYLLSLTDALRALADPAAIEQTVTRLAMQQFAADRCYYCRIENGNAIITQDAMRADLPSVAGTYPLASFVLLKNVIDAGQPFMVEDAATTPILDEDIRAVCLQMQVISFLNVPVIKQGQVVGVLCTVQSVPRHWTEAEIQLAIETADRTWAAVERANAEEALKKSEERLQLATDAAQIGTFVYYPQEDRGEPDAQMLALYGLPPDNTLNLAKALDQLLYPEDRQRYANEVAQALNPAGSGKLDSDIRIVHPDGSVHWMNVKGQVIFENGQGIRMPGVSTDITERKQRERTRDLLISIVQELGQLTDEIQIVRAVGTKLAAHLGLTCYHYVDIDEDRDQVTVRHFWHALEVPPILGTYPLRAFVSPAALAAWRVGRPTIIHDIELELPDDTPEAAVLKAGAAAQQIRAFIAVGLSQEGKWKSYFALADSRPRPWTAVEIDLVQQVAAQLLPRIERVRAEEALQASQKRFESIANLVPDLLWESEPDGSTNWYNQRWLAYTGQRFEEAIGWGWTDAIHPDDRTGSAKRYDKAVAAGQSLRQEHRIRRHDGVYRWFVVNASPLKDQTGQVVKMYGAATDIHDLKRLETTLREAGRRKDEFLAMLAHELRNPLAPVRNGFQLLAQTHQDDQLLGSLLPVMNRQMDHLMRLVDDLLDVSRISRGEIELHKQRLDLTQVVVQAVDAMQPLFTSSGRQLNAQLPSSPLYVDGDATRLHQVVTNLLANGLRYTHEAGQVWLSLELSGEQAILRVRDNGIGLAADQLEAIFGLFVQVDKSLARSHGGLGVGLSLVQELVGRHGGRVEAHSEGPEQGSEFVVYLPLLMT